MRFKLFTRLATLALICFFAALGCSEPVDSEPGDSEPGDSESENGDDDEISCDPESADAEECPDGTTCAYKHLEGRESTDERICHESCDTDDDCPSQRPNCTPEIVPGSKVCSEADYTPRDCDPQATGEDCECGIGDDNAVLVEGSGDDCTIVEEDVSACFEQAMTCLNACVDQTYRYELDDGQAIIADGYHQGMISDGWEPVDQTGDCAALEDDEG